ncbi:MAG: hypothetical protein KGJ23_02395 [Euryarchaeota archaeon]|nr:hypothetical protein [Euryarchaeota archaeon]MDE1835446.1 hypothetical protein [Euryarchaeota archaeon]MDE1879582.1 hypothetical protein [Euryarchaeota archaeon]MDE2046302.1 hypothetical protein [Thermoplasmata archaeon]
MVARPRVTGATSVGRAISALFSTEYEIFAETDPDHPLAHVSYLAKRDEIVIQKDDERWQTRSSAFGPMVVNYNSIDYHIYEKITGRFAILRGEDMIAAGECRFRSVTLPEYPAELEEFLGRLALGLLIRTLFWELAF